MTAIEKVLAKFPDAKKIGKGWLARCPVQGHDDRRASLSISEGDDRRVLVNCFAGCDTEAVLAAVGLEWPDLFAQEASLVPSRNGKPLLGGQVFATARDAVAELERKLGKPTATWIYHNAQGEPVGVTVRWDRPDGKEIRPVARHADGWRIGAMPEPRPLYGLPNLAAAQRVVVAEGEKAAEAARALGFTATTSAGGSQAALKTDWQPLAGKEILIHPDNDPAGHRYADAVAGILAKLTPAPVVSVVNLPNLPDGGDIVDWVDAHGDAAEPDAMRSEIETLAQGVEPPKPEKEEDFAYRPFPTAALPRLIRDFVTAGAKAIGCDPAYLALPLLTAIGAVIGNARRLQLKRGWVVPPILWGAVVSESGNIKSPPFRLVMEPFRERQRKALKRYEAAAKQHDANLARWEKAKAAWKKDQDTNDDPPEKPAPPRAERSIVSDTTIEALAPILLANPRGVLMARDELNGWVSSFDRYAGKGRASTDAANWLSMFNAESIIVDRKTGTPPTIYVPRAAVCISGTIQPGVLRRAFGAEYREAGLLARLLVAWPPRKVKRWSEADIDANAEAELAQMIDRLYCLQPATDNDGEPEPALVRLSDEAKAVMVAYYNAHAVEHAELTGDLAAAWAKLEEYPARLALVVHFSRWAASDATLVDPGRLDADSMSAGVALADWFKNEARRVYAMLDETDADRDLRRLIESIERKGGTVTPREVQRGCRWLKEPGKAEAALQDLVNAGHGTWRDSPTTVKGGRPTRSFVLGGVYSVDIDETPTSPEEIDGFVGDGQAGDRKDGSARIDETTVSPKEIDGFVDVDTVDGPENEKPADLERRGLFGSSAAPPAGPYREGL
jgi:hypothetical protein